jgi:uncharacterized protein with von Willebrand factor type A (vWA) domain
MQRVTGLYKSAVWLNPVREEHWGYTHSIQMVNELMESRMFPLTVEGLTDAMKELAR